MQIIGTTDHHYNHHRHHFHLRSQDTLERTALLQQSQATSELKPKPSPSTTDVLIACLEVQIVAAVQEACSVNRHSAHALSKHPHNVLLYALRCLKL
jgi:hypothetical protein